MLGYKYFYYLSTYTIAISVGQKGQIEAISYGSTK